jgi:isocitrate/isopropylmalate dehydrogenase
MTKTFAIVVIPGDDQRCLDAAARIKAAYNRALADGEKTRDLGGQLNTDDFAAAVIARLDS